MASRKEPQNLTDGKWLEENQFFAKDNVVNTTDSGEHLELEKGNALDFDGENDYATVSDHSSLNFDTTNIITIECWIMLDSIDKGHIITKYAAVGNRSYLLYILDTGEIRFYISSSVFVESTTTLSSGVWYHIAGVADGTNRKIFINGVEEDSALGSDIGESSADIHFCARADTQGDKKNATLKEARIWKKARSESEINEDKDKEIDSNHTDWSDLVAYWKFDEGTGTTFSDSSGENNDGNLQGSPTWVSSYTTFPFVNGEGYRTSSPISLDSIKKVKSSNIKWTSTEPTDTDLKIYTAVSDSNTVEPNTEEEQTLYLGGATGGTFTLGDGTTNTSAIAYDATALTIQTELETIYGSGLVSVVADTDFTITFDISVGVSDLEANFTSLTGDTNPSLTLDDAVDYAEATNDSTIPGISVDDDLTGKYLWVRQELSTEDSEETPRLTNLEYDVDIQAEPAEDLNVDLSVKNIKTVKIYG